MCSNCISAYYSFSIQVFVQSIILYVLKGPGDDALDVSSLVYDQASVLSKFSYILLLLSSVTSVCIDLAKILKWDEKLVITTYLSFTFFKIFLFILTKCLVQSYFLSMAVKSLMFHFAILVDSDENSDLFNDVIELYYRGIYKAPALMTFTQATLYAPLFILSLLFMPSIICAFVSSVSKSGLSFWSENFVQKVVLLFFAVLSNMSFFLKGKHLTSKSSKLKSHETQRTELPIDMRTHHNNN